MAAPGFAPFEAWAFLLPAEGQASVLESQGYFSTDINSAQPGDAIFFSDSNGKVVHTGIVVSVKDGKVYFVHADCPTLRDFRRVGTTAPKSESPESHSGLS